MSVTIPRAELLGLATRYGDTGSFEGVWTAERVRLAAAQLRADTSRTLRPDILAGMADDLDALVDRIENERDAHCVAYSEDHDTGQCECGHSTDEHAGTLGPCKAPLTTGAPR